MSAHGVDRRARASIGSRVVVGGLLALAVVVLVNWLAGRPGIRLRVDLTSAGTASLDPATERVLAALPGPVTVDVFFRPEAPPLDQVAAAVQGRTLDLLEYLAVCPGPAPSSSIAGALGIPKSSLFFKSFTLINWII